MLPVRRLTATVSCRMSLSDVVSGGTALRQPTSNYLVRRGDDCAGANAVEVLRAL